MTGPVISLDDPFVGTSAPLGPGIEICDAAEGLAVINTPGTDLVIWRRPLPACLRAWLDRMEPSRLPDVRVLVQPIDLRRAVGPLLDECGMPPGNMRDLLLGDVDDLVSVFARITRSDLVDVRLQRVANDACWKFHRDCVVARLLTTYLGPGTEWVQPIHAETAMRRQKTYEGPLERLQLHDVAMFKGNCAGPGSGIVHRSPPITGTGQTRLLLCLNTPSVVSPDPWSIRPIRSSPDGLRPQTNR